jgi:hypothetical protein
MMRPMLPTKRPAPPSRPAPRTRARLRPPLLVALAAAALLVAPRSASAQPPGYGPLVARYVVSGCHGTRVCGTGVVEVYHGATDWAITWNATLTFTRPGYVGAFARPEPVPSAFAPDFGGTAATDCPRAPGGAGEFDRPVTCSHRGEGRVPVGYVPATFEIDVWQYDEAPRPAPLRPEQVNFDDGTLVLEAAAVPQPASVGLVATGVVALVGVCRRRR